VQTKFAITGGIVGLGQPVGGANTQGGDRLFTGTVDMQDYDFFPRRVQLPAGSTVSWENKGAVIHTATDSKGAFDTGDIRAGETGSVTISAAGTYTYSCSPHPWMIGQVIIQ
jgi:plastocyanin